MSYDFEKFFQAYVEAAMWTEATNLDENFNVSDIAESEIDEMREDCRKFYDAHAYLWEDSAIAGHDFWLSRNGHGSGFFDNKGNNYLNQADYLQEKAKEFGESYVLIDYYKENLED